MRAIFGTIGKAMAMIRLTSIAEHQPLAEHRNHDHRENDDRERKHDVDDALDEVVDAAAEVA